MGLAGGLAKDQDEPPIAFNLGDTSSQRAYVDCDPIISNLKSEIVSGCQTPAYAANKFDTTPSALERRRSSRRPRLTPFDNWPPFRCVLTQTGNSSQVIQGFNERIFGVTNNPHCPNDDATQYVPGRNYWHRMNNCTTPTRSRGTARARPVRAATLEGEHAEGRRSSSRDPLLHDLRLVHEHRATRSSRSSASGTSTSPATARRSTAAGRAASRRIRATTETTAT